KVELFGSNPGLRTKRDSKALGVDRIRISRQNRNPRVRGERQKAARQRTGAGRDFENSKRPVGRPLRDGARDEGRNCVNQTQSRRGRAPELTERGRDVGRFGSWTFAKDTRQ